MKKSFLFMMVSAALITVSCAKDELVPSDVQGENSSEFIYTASFDAEKTTLDAATGAVAWAEGDQVTMAWDGSAVLSDILSKADISDGKATFHFSLPEQPYGNVYATYPGAAQVSYTSGKYLQITVPAEQDGQFKNASIAAARLEDNHFAFKNVCGLLQFAVPTGVTKVVIASDYVNDLTGKVGVSFDENLAPAVKEVNDCAKELVVNVAAEGIGYAAVIPGTYSGLYVSMFNGDQLVGEKMTVKDVTVARGHIVPLGELPKTVLGDKIFVKPAGSGSKDGSSWDNAMDVAGFTTAVNTPANDGKTFYLAAGTYKAGGQIDINALTNSQSLTIKGGYPADATGTAVVSRDVKANETIISGEDSYRGFVVQKGIITYDGLVLEHCYRSGTDAGTAIIMQGCSNQTINNCVFRNNNTSALGGVLRVAPGSGSTVTITNCLFENNSAVQYGGVMVMTQGHLVSKNNVYRHNISTNTWHDKAKVEYGGGVLFVKEAAAGTTLYFENDLFDGNRAMVSWDKSPANKTINYDAGGTASQNGSSGSVMYLKNIKSGGSVDLKCNGCTFINNRAYTRGCVRVANLTNSSKVMLNACTFAKDSVVDCGSAFHTQTQALVHNCVFYQNINSSASNAGQIYYDTNVCVSNTSIRLGGNSSVGIRENGGVSSVIVNNLIYNGMKGSAIVVASGKTLTSYGHNIYQNSAVEGASPVVDAQGTFTVKDPEQHPDAIYKIDPTWVGSPHYVLKWTQWPGGVAPEGFSLCTPSRVGEALDAFDASTSLGAKAWLQEIGALNKDRRGTVRSSTAIWPGSYDNSASASLDPAPAN